MKKMVIAFLAFAIPAGAVPGAQPTTPKESFDRSRFEIPYQKIVLDNGLTVLVHEDHSVPVVAVNLWYHVGSRNEKRGKTGFAHLFEHFFFNGSENYPHGFREAMDDLGANNRNGTTNTDRTNFFEDVPVSALERTLYLEADRMGFLSGQISKEMLERERGVVQNEKRQGENQPYGRVFSGIAETVYPYSHPYSWSTIGSMKDLDAASLDDVKEWYRTYYGPNNCVLALAGDITPERARELSAKYFGGIAPGPPLPRMETWVPKLDRDIRDEMQDRVPQARIYRVYHAPAWRDPQFLQLSLLGDVLSGSKSARLTRRLVYEKNLATAVNALLNDGELASTFLIIATVKPGVDPATVEKEIDAVVDDLLKDGPGAAELQRAQSRNLSEFVRGSERLGGFGGRSDVLAESMTYGGAPDAYLARLERMATATPAEVRGAGKDWLATNHYTLVVKPYPSFSPGRTMVDRKALPLLGDAPEVKFPEVQRATLSNGLKVMLLERHSIPLVNLALSVDAGFSSDSAAKAGLAGLAMDVLDEGTTTRDAFRIADDLDASGANLSTANTLDLSVVSLDALSLKLGPALDILSDVVLHPSFPEDKVTLIKQQRISRIRQEQAQPNAAALRIVPRLVYGEGHPYGMPLTGSGYEATLTPLTRDELVAWHGTWFQPNNSTLIATGDLTMKQLVPELERVFASWKPGRPIAKTVPVVARTSGKKVYLIDKPDASQSVIVATHVTERGGLPEDLAVETVLANFGGIATSRLNRNLRLDKHWSYGTSGSIFLARGQRPFIVIAPVQTDKTKESIIELQMELRGVAGERPITGEEFASAMRNQTMRLPGSFETLGALTNAAFRMLLFGRNEDYYRNYARNVRNLTEQDLNDAAKAFVRPDEVIWIIVGDLKKIEKGIRELNLGEVIALSGSEM
ncbi:MAG: insulinase family protein [Vicinamibacteria bacterium]|nr:insulinase family protein [Vicinamibacteria bacterium]